MENSRTADKLDRLLAEIEYRREQALLKDAGGYPRNNPVASDLGECAREYVLAMTHWQDRPAFDPWLVARLQRGRLLEDVVLRELSGLGIRVRTERTPFELTDKQGRIVLRGRLDGFVEWDGRDYPMEVKSVNPNVFQRLVSLDDLKRSPFMAKWPRQLWAYLYGRNEDLGFFLFDDCLGHWRLMPVSLDYGEMEQILQRCEVAVAHRAAGTLPPYHDDPEVCRRCWAFGRVCDPPMVRQGFQFLDDGDLEAKIDRWAGLRAARDEWEDLDGDIKATVKGKDGLVVGRWLVTGKGGVRHYKAQPARDVDTWTTKIVPLEGQKRPQEPLSGAEALSRPASPPESPAEEAGKGVLEAKLSASGPEAGLSGSSRGADVDTGSDEERVLRFGPTETGQPPAGVPVESRASLLGTIQGLADNLKLPKATRRELWNVYVGVGVKEADASIEGLTRLVAHLRDLTGDVPHGGR